MILKFVLCTLAAILLAGCIPVYKTLTYWGAIEGRVQTVDGQPLSNLSVVTGYGDCMEDLVHKTVTDSAGKFETEPMRHRIYLIGLLSPGAAIPPPPTEYLFYTGNIYLTITSEDGLIDYQIWWSRFQKPENNVFTIYMRNLNEKLNFDSPFRSNTFPFFYTIKFSYQLLNPPKELIIADDKLKITLDPQIITHIIQKDYSGRRFSY